MLQQDDSMVTDLLNIVGVGKFLETDIALANSTSPRIFNTLSREEAS